jgi:EmrB/QacA subfamily drug resistance transporter
MGLFVLMLDSTVVALALPAIQHDLDASSPALQWVQNAYLLIIATLVVTAGRIGDIAGRRRVFLAGLALFGAGSALAALAPSPDLLIAGRVVQGAGGAAMLALSLAIVSDAFPDAERPRALGLWAAVSGISLAVGPLVGGALVEAASWRWIFWLNLPFLAAGLLITLRATRESRDETAGGEVDWPGLATLGTGLLLVVLALVQAKGWPAGRVLGLAAGGAALLAAFVLVERRAREPIVDFALFRNGSYFGATMAGFTLVGAYWAVMFYEPQYLQDILGHSALEAGLLVLPITVPMVVLSPLVPRLEARFGTRGLMTFGMALGAAGLAVMALAGSARSYGRLLPGYLLFGLALGFVYASMSTAAMTAMPREKAGIASGVLAMSRVLAGALVLAAVGALFQHLLLERRAELLPDVSQGGPAPGADLDALLAGSADARAEIAGLPLQARLAVETAARDAFGFAMGRGLWVCAAIVVLGALLTWRFVRDAPRVPAPAPEHHARHRRLPF